MEDRQVKVSECCRCCAQPIADKGYRSGEMIYCNAEHSLVHERYLRLAKKAKEKAARYPAHEIDYRIADFYLRTKLRQFRENLATVIA
jgi:hypothetical protein